MRKTVALLTLAGLGAFVPGGALPPGPLPVGATIELAVTVIQAANEILQLDEKSASQLDGDRPGIILEEFALQTPTDFNVGDQALLNLRFTVSYGSIGNWGSPLRRGRGKVAVYVDNKVLRVYPFEGRPGQRIETRQFKAGIAGHKVGSARVYCKVSIEGENWTPIRDLVKPVESPQTPDRILEVKPPYEVWIEGPRPGRVYHGEPVKWTLWVDVHTQARGRVEPGTQLDGALPRQAELPGAANPGAVVQIPLIQVTKPYRGCPYGRLGRREEIIMISSATYKLAAFLEGGGTFVQSDRSHRLPLPTEAVSQALACAEGDTFEERGCRCVPRDVKVAERKEEEPEAVVSAPEPEASPAESVVSPVARVPEQVVVETEAPPGDAPPPVVIPARPAVELRAPAYGIWGRRMVLIGGPFGDSPEGVVVRAGQWYLPVLEVTRNRLTVGLPKFLPLGPLGPITVETQEGTSVAAISTLVGLDVERIAVHRNGPANFFRVLVNGSDQQLDLLIEVNPADACQPLGKSSTQLRTYGGTPNVARFWCNGTGGTRADFSIEILDGGTGADVIRTR